MGLKKFNYDQDFQSINFRQHPELYQVGKGEQGVLLVQPYKDEILPYWKFKTPEVAHASASAIYKLFLEYKVKGDFVGMDMARKFLQMGFTRARRYANHPSGRKYKKGTKTVLPTHEDPVKAESARIFYRVYLEAREDADYQTLRRTHQQAYG